MHEIDITLQAFISLTVITYTLQWQLTNRSCIDLPPMMQVFHAFSFLLESIISGSRYRCTCVKAGGYDTSNLQCCKQHDAEGEV